MFIHPYVFKHFFSCPILSLLLLNSNYSHALPLNSVLQFIEPLFHLSIFFSLFFSFSDFFLSCTHIHTYFLPCILFVINSTQQIFGLDTVFFSWKISVSPITSITSPQKILRIIFIILIALYKSLISPTPGLLVDLFLLTVFSLDYEQNSLVSSQVLPLILYAQVWESLEE